MKVLLVNKFLFPKGGAETYVFKLGEMLEKHGHKVEYFGLENEKNIVGNSSGAFVKDIDFSKGTKKNLTAPFRIIYSSEARRKLREVLRSFEPDIIHFNNIQFHLTPSMLIEARDFAKKENKKLKIIYTAHDYQLICPSHGLFDSKLNICEKCIGGKYLNCIQNSCVKKSKAKSMLAAADAYFWEKSKAYSYIDTIICPSRFMKSKLDMEPRFAEKTKVLHNFIEKQPCPDVEKEGYILEFGHLSKDKGTYTLLEVAKRIPDTRFVFAGYGEAEEDIKKVANAEFIGFKTGEELKLLIAKAAVTVCPSEIYENCPYAVIESQMLGTPTLGSDMGGIPELIEEGKTGFVFKAGNSDDLENKVRLLINNKVLLKQMTENCSCAQFETAESYYNSLIKIYED